MPSIRKILGAVAVGLAAVTSALPAQPRISTRALRAMDLVRRQNPATGLPDGLGDVDILQLYVPTPLHLSSHLQILTGDSALTLEFLEAAFYKEGFAKFPDSDFAALGLAAEDIVNLKSIGATEQTHVSTLLTAIATSGTKPVAPCTYNFGLTDAASMIATAAILENVGVSA
jgi:hypothetical protein